MMPGCPCTVSWVVTDVEPSLAHLSMGGHSSVERLLTGTVPSAEAPSKTGKSKDYPP